MTIVLFWKLQILKDSVFFSDRLVIMVNNHYTIEVLLTWEMEVALNFDLWSKMASWMEDFMERTFNFRNPMKKL